MTLTIEKWNGAMSTNPFTLAHLMVQTLTVETFRIYLGASNSSVEVWKWNPCLAGCACQVSALVTHIYKEGKVASCQAETLCSCKRPLPRCTTLCVGRVFLITVVGIQRALHTCCLHTHSYTYTHLSPWLFVCLHVAPTCPHDCKCKMWIWMAEKRELVFVKQQAFARHSPEGGECQTCVPQCCSNVFSLCLKKWVHFHPQKNGSCVISMGPSMLFFKNTFLLLNFSLFILGCGVGGVLFLFPESTRHQSQAAYLISHEENPCPQLLLIRVKWSRPTNS